MSDLVSRSELLARYDRIHVGAPGAARKLIEEAPAVDAVPVRHGRWETNNDPEEIVKDFSCSVCEELLCDFDTFALMPGENCFYYCPNCGAKMDGGNDEAEKI